MDRQVAKHDVTPVFTILNSNIEKPLDLIEIFLRDNSDFAFIRAGPVTRFGVIAIPDKAASGNDFHAVCPLHRPACARRNVQSRDHRPIPTGLSAGVRC